MMPVRGMTAPHFGQQRPDNKKALKDVADKVADLLTNKGIGLARDTDAHQAKVGKSIYINESRVSGVVININDNAQSVSDIAEMLKGIPGIQRENDPHRVRFKLDSIIISVEPSRDYDDLTC